MCRNRKSKSLTIWNRVEPEEDFRKRRSHPGGSRREEGSKINHDSPSTSREAREKTEPTTNPSKAAPVVDIVDLTKDSNESSSDEEKPKYPNSFADVMDHFDEATREEALNITIKDVATLSDRTATKLQWRHNNNLSAEDNVLDSINDPNVDISSLSSHVTVARKLMRSVDYIEDEELKKLVGKASKVHCDIKMAIFQNPFGNERF